MRQALPLAAAYDEGVSRSLFFNAHALPALAHYRLVEWQHRDDSEEAQKVALQPLHERCGVCRAHGLRSRVRPLTA